MFGFFFRFSSFFRNHAKQESKKNVSTAAKINLSNLFFVHRRRKTFFKLTFYFVSFPFLFLSRMKWRRKRLFRLLEMTMNTCSRCFYSFSTSCWPHSRYETDRRRIKKDSRPSHSHSLTHSLTLSHTDTHTWGWTRLDCIADGGASRLALWNESFLCLPHPLREHIL